MTSVLAVMTTCISFPFHASATSGLPINENYQEFVSSFEAIPREEELLLMWQDKDPCFKHIYESDSIYDIEEDYLSTQFFEFGESVRQFQSGEIYWNVYYFSLENAEICNAENIALFLQENNLKAKISDYDIYDRNGTFVLDFEEDITAHEIVDTALALYNEFDSSPQVIRRLVTAYFYYEPVENTEPTSPTITFGTPTIAGDANMDGATSMADIAKLAKYVSNAELFPITDPTALANADVTQDGVIDSLDTNMLIEIALGTYESAV